MAIVSHSVAAPGANTDTTILFSTVVEGHDRGALAKNNIKRLRVDIKHSHGFTLKWYKAEPDRTTWHQLGEKVFSAVSGETLLASFRIDMYGDFKLELVNGGTAQSPWALDMALTED